MKTRDHWQKLAMQTNDPAAWPWLVTKLPNWKLHVERLKGISSKNVHVLSQNSNDTNVMWKTIRSCIPKKLGSQWRFNSDDDKTIADRLNQLFTSVGETMNQKIKQPAHECGYDPAANLQSRISKCRAIYWVVWLL